MQNPFESGHIKNYVLLYASVVVIVILFFIASSLFIDEKEIQMKVFNTEIKEVTQEVTSVEENSSNRFKLLEKAF